MQEAEAMYRRALEGKEKAWGLEHPSTLNTVNNLGNLYADQGKMQEAEAMYRRALEGYEKAWGPEHTSTLDTVNNLAILYKNQCKLEEAEAIYRVSALPKPWLLENPSSYGGLTLVGSANRLPIEQVACHVSNSSGPTIENNTRIFCKEQLEEPESDTNEMQDIEQSTENIQKPDQDEIQSLASDDEDISSQISCQKSSQRALAERQIGALMAHHPELNMVYNEAIALMPVDRFVANFRRLLKRYYLDIRPLASTSLERTAV